MNLTLTRTFKSASGIFGKITDETYALVPFTLEHAYPIDTSFVPKLPIGEYTCVRGMHQLEGMHEPFETFEVTNVPGHTGILFHVGNWNQDSEGCILLGEVVVPSGPSLMLSRSKEAFENFMDYLKEIDTFLLTVQNQYSN